MLQTIQKASQVLALFDQNQTEWGVREVAARLQLPKSSAHDLLNSLSQTGFLNKTVDGRYRLGWRLVSMSETLLSTTELCLEARPVMVRMAEQYRETINLGVLSDTKVVFVDKIDGKQTVRVDLNTFGARFYTHCTAIGKVLLAYQPAEEVERIIQKEGLPRFTSNTITDPGELHLALNKIRQQGYAYDLEELMQDLCCVAAPIYNYTGRIVAAICLSIPIYRFLRSQSEFRTGSIRAASVISEHLGYEGR